MVNTPDTHRLHQWSDARLAGRTPTKISALIQMAEPAIIVFGFVIYATHILRIILGNPGHEDPLIVKLAFFGFYGVTAVLILRRFDTVMPQLWRNGLILILIALPFLSFLWSTNPNVTLTRSIALGGSSLFGIYLACCVNTSRSLHLLAIAGLISALLSFAAIIAAPAIGVAQTGPWAGSWIGVYGHKNHLGAMTALFTTTSLLVLNTRGWFNSPLVIMSFIANGLLLAVSKSLTAQIVCLASILMMTLVPLLVRPMARNWALAILAIAPPIIGLFVLLNADDIGALLELMGKDATMSARLPIWENAISYINRSIWLGYGYDAFWEPSNWPVRIIEFRLHFRPFYSHNGLIELWLGMGLLGVIVFTLVLMSQLLRSIRFIYKAPNEMAVIFSIAFLTMFLLVNVSENGILARNSLLWVLFVANHFRLNMYR